MAIISQGRVEQWEDEPLYTFTPDILYDDGKPYDAIFNPSMCKDDKDQIWISARAVMNDLDRIEAVENRKPTRYHNYLLCGKLDEDTLKTSDWKRIDPVDNFDGFFWGIEDVRLFWREDGLHGIGVTFNHEIMSDSSWRIQQSEILIDYEKGTYSLIATYPSPLNINEKNWSPPVKPIRYFDFAYSNTQTLVCEDNIAELAGEPDGSMQLHNGTQLLDIGKDFIQVSHIPTIINNERVYANTVTLRNRYGIVTDISQFWIWRKRKHQSIEFVSGIVMTKKGVLVSMGIQDDGCALAYLNPLKLNWRPYEAGSQFYRWRYTPNSA